MINTYRMIAGRNKILICFVACLIFALSSSCAQKKSAIEKLIVQKPSDETKRKVEEEKIRQSEAKRTVEVTKKTEEDAHVGDFVRKRIQIFAQFGNFSELTCQISVQDVTYGKEGYH